MAEDKTSSEEPNASPLNSIAARLASKPVLLAILFALIALAAYFTYSVFSTTSEFKVSVQSSSSPVEGALVEVLSSDGKRIAQGTTAADGSVLFRQKLPSSGRVALMVSKEGFLAADGSASAVAVIELGKRKGISLELFASQVQGGEFSQGITFTVQDKITRQPIAGASLDASVSGRQVIASTDAAGNAFVQAQKGDLLLVKVSAPNYYSDSRAYTAIRSEEKILLSPRLAGGVSFSSENSSQGGLPKITSNSEAKASESVFEKTVSGEEALSFSMPSATIGVRDENGVLVRDGLVSVVSESGQVVAQAIVSNGVATIFNLPISSASEPGFSLQLSGTTAGTTSGTISVIDSTANTTLFSSLLNNGRASLSTSSRLTSLSVTAQTISGAPVPSGAVRAFDAVTNQPVGEAQLFNGLAIISSTSSNAISPNTLLTISLEAQGFSAPTVQATFGRTPAVTLVATQLPSAQIKNTSFKAFAAESELPISFNLTVYRKEATDSNTPVFSGQVSSEKVLSLPVGTYSAVFSSQSRYTLTVSDFSAGALVELTLPLSNAAGTSKACVTVDATRSCRDELLSPSNFFTLSTTVSDKLGQPLAGASVSLKDNGGTSIFTARSDAEGKAQFTSVRSGAYNLSAAFSGFYSSKLVTLASNSDESIAVELKASVFAGAKSISGANVPATFSVEGTGISCSTSQGAAASRCSLSVDANKELTISANSPGYSAASASRKLSPGQVLPLTLELVRSDAGAQVFFRGARDSLGRQVPSLLAGEDYVLEFSFSSQAADETTLAVRLGDAASVSQEDYGIIDFQPPASSSLSAKSTSYSPLPACVDLNNNNAMDGLFKWAQISFNNKGAPMHHLVSIPVRVKANANSPAMKVYYRLAVRTGSSVLRIPEDTTIGNLLDAPSLAGCYAELSAASLRIAFTNTCKDGARQGQCSQNTPLLCARASSNSGLSLSPSVSCCPSGTSLSNGLCVLPSPPAGTCADGTAQQRCSAINKPYLCTGGSLVAAVSCCPAGQLFDNGVCRPQGASCQLAGTTFNDGACLPTEPGRCLDGLEKDDAAACGCPVGKTLSANGNECVASACSDGTPAGQCSSSPENSLKKCVLSPDGASPTLQVSPSCSCPAGSQLQAGACVACASSDCGLPSSISCSVDSKLYSPGCITGKAPLLCNSGGRVSQQPSACGCPTGSEFSLQTLSCTPSSSLQCTDATSSNSCSPNKPKQCVSLGGSLLLVDNALACGCPDNFVSNGVECRAAQAIPTPGSTTPTSTPTPTPPQFGITPRPPARVQLQLQECSTPNRCLSPDSTDEYCTAQGLVARSCLLCNSRCGGSEFLSCNPASGTCDALKCVDPIPFGTSVGQCVAANSSARCQLVNGAPGVVQSSAACGCPAGQKPEGQGEQCVQCANSDCAGEIAYACFTSDGRGYAAGQCLPKEQSFISANGAEPIKKCLSGGSIVPAIVDCGCPTGFKRSFDNGICVPELSPSAPLDNALNLTPEITCPGCVASDDVFFDATGNRLKTHSGRTQYAMVADTVFPADAFNLSIQRASSSFRISAQAISSTQGTAGCYSYDENTGVFKFRLGNACPIEIRANSFFHTGSNNAISSDQVTLTLRHETVPPQDLALTIKLALNSAESLRLQPLSLSGPQTPQLIYLINNKQTIFGPRTLVLESSSTTNNELPGAGVKVFAWRGPGTLSISEKGESLGTLSYQTTASYFTCTAGVGQRIDNCVNNAFCCAGGWCNPSAFRVMLSNFRTYSKNLAAQTAFRRGLDSSGNGQPFTAISGNAPFEVFTAAGLVDGAPTAISQSGVDVTLSNDCSSVDRPGVFQIKASTTDGKRFDYSAQTAFLHKFDYVDGACPDKSLFVGDALLARPDEKAMPLCDFLFGADCACLQRSAHSNLLTAPQNRDGKSALIILPFLGLLIPLIMQAAQAGGRPGDLDKACGGKDGCKDGKCGKIKGGKRGCPNGNCGGGGDIGGIAEEKACSGNSCSIGLLDAIARRLSMRKLSQKENVNEIVGEKAPPEVVPELDSAKENRFTSVASLDGLTTLGGLIGPLCAANNDAGKFADLVKGPIDTTYNKKPEDLSKQCQDESQKYVDQRKKTDEKCAGERTSVQRTGKRTEWVAKGKAEKSKSHNGECVLSCTAKENFRLTDHVNKGEIVDELDKCEDEDHEASGPGAGSTAPTSKKLLSKKCQDRVEAKIEKVNSDVSRHIDAQVKACKGICLSNECGDECIPGYQLCVNACKKDGVDAKQDLNNNLNECQAEVKKELDQGDACEDLAQYMTEEPASTVDPEPKQRKAYFNCYAFGTKEKGICQPICQQMHSFVQWGHADTGANQVSQVNRHGIGKTNGNGACEDSPPKRAAELAGKNVNDIENACAQSRFVPQPLPHRKVTVQGCFTACQNTDNHKIATGVENQLKKQGYEVAREDSPGSVAYVKDASGNVVAAQDAKVFKGKPVDYIIKEMFTQVSNKLPIAPLPSVKQSAGDFVSLEPIPAAVSFLSPVGGSGPTPFDPPKAQGTGLLCVLDNKLFDSAGLGTALGSGTSQFEGQSVGDAAPIPRKQKVDALKKEAEDDKDYPGQSQPFIAAHTNAQNMEKNRIPDKVLQDSGLKRPGQGQGALDEFGNDGSNGGFGGSGGSGGGGGGPPPGGNPAGMSQMMQQLLPALMQMLALNALNSAPKGSAKLGEACTKPEQCKSGLCMVSKDATGKDNGLKGYCTIVCPALADRVAAADRKAPSQPSQISQFNGLGYPQPPLGFNQQYPYGYPYAYNQYPFGFNPLAFNQPLVPIIRSAEKLAELFFQTATPPVSASAKPAASPSASPARFTQAQRNQKTLADAISGCPRINDKLTICCTDCGEKPACTIA